MRSGSTGTTPTAPCDAGILLETGDITAIDIVGTNSNDSVTISHAGTASWPDAINFTSDGEGGTDTLTITGDTTARYHRFRQQLDQFRRHGEQ
jgi:hypothetical protein